MLVLALIVHTILNNAQLTNLILTIKLGYCLLFDYFFQWDILIGENNVIELAQVLTSTLLGNSITIIQVFFLYFLFIVCYFMLNNSLHDVVIY